VTARLTTLPNGFRIVTEAMPGFESAAVGVWVLAGARNEAKSENGIAHFLEHMAFKGTGRRSAVQIAEAIEDVGGHINAYTSREATAYYARVLRDDVPLAVDVLADILRNSALDPNEMNVERGVILQEIGLAHDTPDDIIFDWLQEQAYPDHPLGRSILGAEAGVRGFARPDLEGFVDRHYRPGHMVLAAAGAIDHDALVRLAGDLFGDMTPAPVAEAPRARFRGGEMRSEKSLEQAHFALAFEGPSCAHEDIYASQVYATALGGSMSSRLFQELRERRGLCYTIFAQAGAYADTGMTTIYAGTSPEAAGALAEVTIDELKRAAEDMSEAEIARGRAQMKAGLLMGLESPADRAERLARMIQVWGHVPAVADVIARIDAVDVGGVRREAESIVARAPAALALYGPVSKVPDLARLDARRAA